MGMTPYDFYGGFVLPNYWDYENELGDVRLGFNAAVAASHMADHCFWYFHKHSPAKIGRFPQLEDYVNYLSQKTDGLFWDIHSVANAYKHLYTRSEASVSSGGAIDSITRLPGDITEIAAETSPSIVVYRRRTGERCELLPALKKVVDFWSEELDARDSDSP